jgi:hypothetical protein
MRAAKPSLILGSILYVSLCGPLARATELPVDLARAAARFERAQIEGDAPVLEELTSLDYELVNASGAMESRREFIQDWTAPGFDPDPVTVREAIHILWPDGAALGGLVTLTGSNRGERFSVTFRYLDLWIRREGRWQVVHGQATRVPDVGSQ